MLGRIAEIRRGKGQNKGQNFRPKMGKNRRWGENNLYAKKCMMVQKLIFNVQYHGLLARIKYPNNSALMIFDSAI